MMKRGSNNKHAKYAGNDCYRNSLFMKKTFFVVAENMLFASFPRVLNIVTQKQKTFSISAKRLRFEATRCYLAMTKALFWEHRLGFECKRTV